MPSPYPSDPLPVLPPNAQKSIVGLLICISLIVMGFEIVDPDIVFFIDLVIVMATGIITPVDTLAGFSNDGMITVASLFLVVKAVEKSHIVDLLVRKAFGLRGWKYVDIFKMYILMWSLSIFFNNTPLVALMIPPVRDWARVRNIPSSQLMMPLSFSVLLGCMGSMIGTSTNLVIQGLLKADKKRNGFQFSLFAPMVISAPVGIPILLFMLAATPWLLPHNKTGLLRVARDLADELVTEVEVLPASVYVGQTLALALGDLGIPTTVVVKIRRRGTVELQPAKDEAELARDRASYSTKLAAWGKAKLFPGSTTADEEAKLDEEAPNDQFEYFDIIAPDVNTPLFAGDILFLGCAKAVLEKLAGSVSFQLTGLRVLNSNALGLIGTGTELIEAVLADTSPLVGKSIGEALPVLKSQYNIGVIAFRPRKVNETPREEPSAKLPRGTSLDRNLVAQLFGRKEKNDADDNDNDDSRFQTTQEPSFVNVDKEDRGIILSAGDLVLAVASKEQLAKLKKDTASFFVVTQVGGVPPPVTAFGLIPVVVFALMLCLVASDKIEMGPVALCTSAFFLLGGWIDGDDITKCVEWRLLILISTSIAFSKSITTSGLAKDIADGLASQSASPDRALFTVYAITCACTEIINNNAAASLLYPIAVQFADNLKVSYKPFAMAVMFGASMGFAFPIGYQTHMMVWKPGGYRFMDFVKLGLLIDVLYLIGACLLIPQFFPFK